MGQIVTCGCRRQCRSSATWNPNIPEPKICHSHGCQSNHIIKMMGQILDNQLDFIIVPDAKEARYTAINYLPKNNPKDVMLILVSSERLFSVESHIHLLLECHDPICSFLMFMISLYFQDMLIGFFIDSSKTTTIFDHIFRQGQSANRTGGNWQQTKQSDQGGISLKYISWYDYYSGWRLIQNQLQLIEWGCDIACVWV